MYREHCQFDTKEESPLQGIDVEENFFTPTMTKYRQERNKEVIQYKCYVTCFFSLR
jgi:hypothetical protein